MHEPSGAVVGVTAEDRPLKQLVSDLGKNMGLLVRQEVQLAKVEITEKISRTSKGATKVGIGAFVAYAGLLALAAALVLLGVAAGLTPWLAAALVGLLLIVGGNLIVQSGRRSLAPGEPALPRTTHTTRETVQHLKEQWR